MEFLFLPLIIGAIALPAPVAAGRTSGRLHSHRRRCPRGGIPRRQRRSGTSRDNPPGRRPAVTVLIGQQSVEMNRDAILSVERARDTNTDGVIKGALVGLLVGWIAETNTPNANGRYLFQGVLTYGGLGYLFDRGVTARQPLYRRK